MNNTIREGKGDYLVYREGSGHTLEIFDIVVVSERRRGVGSLMVGKLLDTARVLKVTRVWAITRADNFVAQQFYESQRFRSVPLRDFYGNGGIDAVMYIRDLESQA